MDVRVTAALIAAGVTLVGFVVTLITTRWQLKSKIDELTQTQFKGILAKRIAVYPSLWQLAQTELSDIERVEKLTNPNWRPQENRWAVEWAPNADWARDLLERLMRWHQVNGAFLSQASYEAFAKLRSETFLLVRTCNLEQRDPLYREFHTLDRIFYSGYEDNGEEKLPLATCLKNDLGSYKLTYLSH